MRIVSHFAAFVFLPVCFVVFTAWGIAAVVDGNVLSGVIAIIFSVGVLFFIAQWAVMRWGARLRAQVDPGGTTIRPRKLFDVLSLIFTGAATLAALLYVALTPLGLVDIPTYRSSTPWLAVFLLVVGIPTVGRMVAHGGDSYLRLTPDGCDVWNGPWLTRRRANWEDIEQIRDQPLRRKLRSREAIVLVLPEGRSATLLADAVTKDSRALREWVRFYWQHPEYREELVDNRGLRRLASFNTDGATG
ncbi:hypothetical protein [Mycolicibacterium thermoresistibile]